MGCFDFQVKESGISRFRKAYVGIVENHITSYNMSEFFKIEGFLSVQVTTLGADLCFLEDRVEGELKVLVEEGNE